MLGATIVRVRGFMQVRDVDLPTGEQLYVRAGMYIGNQNELTRGPDANDSAYDTESAWKDWFLFEPFFLADETETAHANSPLTGRMIDVRSSRKLEELNQTVIFDISGRNFAAAGATTAALHWDLSMLLMLA